MRLLEKAPSERYAGASDVLERLQRELRALTRDDPASIVRSALVETGLATGGRRTEGTPSVSSWRSIDAVRAIAGHAFILVAFVIGVLAIESGSAARGGIEAGNRPLELMPDQAGGLRVLASPWANVRVDGQ